MPNKPKHNSINKVEIRTIYTRQTIESLLHTHFANKVAALEAHKGTVDTTKLKQFMGVTFDRWEKLKDGAAPTLAEAAAYAAYMEIDITDLYELIPYKAKKTAK